MNARRCLPLFALFASPLALAHPGHAEMATFAQGFLHPITGLDHLLAMLAVGLWSAGQRRQTSAARLLAMPLAFVAALLVGVLLGSAGHGLPAVEAMIAASLLAFGVAAFLPRIPQALALLAMAMFGLCHGLAHGAELGTGAGAAVGIVLASALLHLCGVGLGANPVVRRVASAAVAGAGIVFMLQLT